MRCPKCKNHILQKSGSRTRLRTKGPIAFETGVCKTQCYWCGGSIEIPVEIREGTPISSETFVILRKT